MTDEVGRQLNVTLQELGDTFETLKTEGQLLGFAGRWATPATVQTLRGRLEDALEKLHEAAPKKPLVPFTKAASSADIRWSGKPLERLFQHFEAEGWLIVEEAGVRLGEFQLALTPKQRIFLDRVMGEIVKESVNVPSPIDLARALGAPIQAVEGILEFGTRTGELVDLGSQIWYTPEQLEELAKRLKKLTKGESVSVKAIRDGLETSRKYVLPLLEHFERTGVAVADGERRVFK